MAIRIVRLGTSRAPGEGPRLGTVRRPPRGVPRSEYARQDWFDVWLPNLAPSAELIRTARPENAAAWKTFAKRYEAELKKPDQSHLLDALVALSRQTDFSIGCYCEDESRCHRSVLRRVLRQRGADVR